MILVLSNCWPTIRSLSEAYLTNPSRSFSALAVGFSVVIAFLAGCSRTSGVIERVALLPANVLVSDNSSQWLKIGVPLVLQQDLMTARSLIPGVTLNESSAAQAKATKVLRTTVESRQRALHIQYSLIDAKTQKVTQEQSVDAASAADVISALDSLAKKLDANASAYPTRNVQALQSYLSAASTNDRGQRVQLLNQAIKQDSGFGLAYLALMEMMPPGQQQGLAHFVDEAKSNRDKFQPYDRAKFDLAVSRLNQAPAAEQIKQAEEALKFAPNDLEAIVALGNNQFLEGDAQAGESTLRRAVTLNPGNPGLQLQLGRGLMEARKLKEADAIFVSIQNIPAVLPDLATCALLEGDTARANTIAEKFFSSIQNEQLKPLVRASWQVMSGQRQKGVETLLTTKFDNPRMEAVALSEAALWQLMGKDDGGAKSTIQRASSATSEAGTFPAVAALLGERDSSPAEWRKRVQSSALPENVKEPALAYGLFVRGDYADAVTEWRRLLERSHGSDLRARAMLASSLDHAGKKSEAKAIHVTPFVPEFGDLYGAIPFLEMRRVLGL